MWREPAVENSNMYIIFCLPSLAYVTGIQREEQMTVNEFGWKSVRKGCSHTTKFPLTLIFQCQCWSKAVTTFSTLRLSYNYYYIIIVIITFYGIIICTKGRVIGHEGTWISAGRVYFSPQIPFLHIHSCLHPFSQTYPPFSNIYHAGYNPCSSLSSSSICFHLVDQDLQTYAIPMPMCADAMTEQY